MRDLQDGESGNPQAGEQPSRPKPNRPIICAIALLRLCVKFPLAPQPPRIVKYSHKLK